MGSNQQQFFSAKFLWKHTGSDITYLTIHITYLSGHCPRHCEDGSQTPYRQTMPHLPPSESLVNQEESHQETDSITSGSPPACNQSSTSRVHLSLKNVQCSCQAKTAISLEETICCLSFRHTLVACLCPSLEWGQLSPLYPKRQ